MQRQHLMDELISIIREFCGTILNWQYQKTAQQLLRWLTVWPQ